MLEVLAYYLNKIERLHIDRSVGTSVNSPTIYRWEYREQTFESRQGRQDATMKYHPSRWDLQTYS